MLTIAKLVRLGVGRWKRDAQVVQPIRVLIDNREQHWGQNPFVQLWSESLDADIMLMPFTWRRALFGNYDLIHFNWPEYLFVYRNRFKHFAGWLLTLGLVARMKMAHTPYVRSFHDIDPWVTVSAWDRFLIRALDGLVSHVVYLTDPRPLGVQHHAALSGKPVSLIKHPEYGPLVGSLATGAGDQPAGPDMRGSAPFMLCFGILRPYKAYETVIDAFLNLDPSSNVRLKIMGAAPDTEYLDTLKRRIGGCPLIDLRVGRVPDEVLIEEIQASRCVVVPYERLYNSGVVFLALSVGVPVLLRDGPVAAELQHEYGDEFVKIYTEDITAAVIDSVIHAPSPTKVAPPIERSWSYAGAKYSDLYRTLVSSENARPHAGDFAL
jgi:beta-1,4-mannosyltransferase